jgi:Sec-independent protein translocase protein TatA
MFGMSMWEILVVLALLFIVVGPGKLPGLAKKMGELIRGLKGSLADVKATVDKNDEFVKAISEARASVAEAKSAVREIIDDVVSVAPDLNLLEEELRDPAPKAVPKGRKRVSRASDEGPTLVDEDEPFEAEDWRASAREDRTAEAMDEPGEEGGSVDRPTGARIDDGGVPSRTQRRGSTGRRMIKPGRSRDGDGE